MNQFSILQIMAKGSTSRDTEEGAALRAMQRMFEAQQEHNRAQQEYNRLMQERLDRQEDVGRPAIGAPPPPPLRTGTVADFKRLGPSIFAGTETPLEAEQWMVKTEQLLKAARVPEADRVDVVSIQLTDLAHIWWTNELTRLEAPVTWETFSEAFLEKFFPETAKFEMERKFTHLTQGNRSVDEYAAEFTRLSRFAPTLVADEATRARRFKMGLNFSILENVVSLRLPTYGEVLIAAREQEIVQGRRRAVQRPAGNASSGKPSAGPIRRPAPTSTARVQPYQKAPDAQKVVCEHCSKPGHMKKECRSFLNLCLACGAKDHALRDCPKRNGPSAGQQQQRQQQTFAKGQGKPAAKGGNPGARGQAFNLTTEEAGVAEGVVEGTSIPILLFPCIYLIHLHAS